MFNPAAAQIAQQLGDMFIGQGFARLQLNDQFSTDEQVGKIVAENCSILVQHLQSMLLFNLNARFAKPAGSPFS